MKRPLHPLRGALALLAGILFALGAAAPAAAAPVPFTVGDTGEDYCTLYEATGTADWADIVIRPSVDIEGKASTTIVDDTPCLDVEPFPRHVEFIAYAQDRPVDEHREALGNTESGFAFAFTLTAETSSIDYVTVAICRTESVIGQPVFECTDPVKVGP